MKKHMKIFMVLTIAAALTAFSGCGKAVTETAGKAVAETKAELTLRNHRIDKTIEVKSGAVASYADQTEAGKVTRHLICLANFQMDLAAAQKWTDLHMVKVADEEQIKICFTLNGEKGFDENNQLKVGTYPMADTRAFQPGTISHNAISVWKKGDYIVHDPAKARGEVKITSVEGEKINGEVNLAEGTKSIKGSFTALTLKVK